MDLCLKVLKESNKTKFDSYSVRNSVFIISQHITFRDCRVHIFSDNLSGNSCIHSSHFFGKPSQNGHFSFTNSSTDPEDAKLQSYHFHRSYLKIAS